MLVQVHTPNGDQQISQEGSASSPRLTADGSRVYYMTGRGTPGASTLWVADTSSGRSEPALPGVEIGREFSVDPDGKNVAYLDPAGALWIAPLDRRSAPRKLSDRRSLGVDLMASGNLYHLVPEADGVWLYRLRPDGNDSKALNVQGRGLAVSPDEKWASSNVNGDSLAIPLSGGNPVRLCRRCFSTWGVDGRSMLFHYRSVMGDRDLTVQIPCKPGSLPALPQDGLSGRAEAEKFPGARTFSSYMPPSAAGDVYAYIERTRHANIFRLTLP
jgi:Tol biopolymer transport system component